MDGTGSEPAPKEPLQPGVLIAEPFSWKSLVTGQPVMRLRTTGTRASVLCLPEGLVYECNLRLSFEIKISFE